MAGKCVLFTGPSGVNSQGSLIKLSNYCERQGLPRPAVVTLDDWMITRHLEQYPDDDMRVRMRQPGGFQYLLLQPKGYLLKLWHESVAAALSTIPPTQESVFLSMHSVFYHTSSRDFFPCVDLNYLVRCLAEKDLQIDIVITLIDDIYDAWRRLKEPGQLFSATDEAVRAILNLLLLLDWRSMEVFSSAGIARDLRVSHFLLGVKHPLSVPYDVIFSKKVPIYIAHPITYIQDLERKGDRAGADRLKRETQRLMETFMNSSVVTPILPTGIDELIFDEDSSCPGRLLPKLGVRWLYGDPTEILFIPPDSTIPEPFNLYMPETTGEMSLLVKGLAEVITSQIDSRDRTLVEQTEALVAWRPYCNGHPSSGVSNEITHRNMLVERGLVSKEDRPVLALIRLKDLGLLRINIICDLLASRAEKRPASMTMDSVRERLISTVLDSLSSEAGTLSGEELSEAVDPTGLIDFPLRLDLKGALGPDQAVARRKEQARNWEEIASEVNQFFPPGFDFYDTDVVLYDDALTITQFLHRVEERLRRKKIEKEEK